MWSALFFRENLSLLSKKGCLLLLYKDVDNTKEYQDDNYDSDFFTKMREQNIAKRNGKSSSESPKMKNFMDYNSHNDFKFYPCGQIYQRKFPVHFLFVI